MKAELRTIDDVVEVFVNGEMQSRMWGRLSLPAQNAPEKLGQYMHAGIDVYLTTVELAWNNGWNGDATYDYRDYEVHLDRILAVKPDCKLVLYVGYPGAAPYRWCRANEDQLALLSNGDRLRMGSFASTKWLADSNRAMAAFIRHFQNSKYAENIIGINPVMYSNEWHTPATRNHPPLDDYSKPMAAHFRDWLRDKYEGDEEALRESWRMRDAAFATAQIPPETRRVRTGADALPFGERDMWTFDYESCLNEARERFIIETCRAIKEASDGTLLTCLSRRDGSLEMLKSKSIDVYHGPYGYLNRKLGHVYGYSRRNLALHGKLAMYQIDTGTHVMPRTGGDPLGVTGLWNGPQRLADNEWESLELLERDVCKAIADRRYVYWTDGGPGWMFPVSNPGVLTYGRLWFDTPAIKERIAGWKRLVDRLRATAPRSSANVALVGTDYQRHDQNAGNRAARALFNLNRTEFALQRSGVAYDTYTLEDFANIRRSYRVYIFPDAFRVEPSLRDSIQRKLADYQATAVWLYAPGYIGEKGGDLAGVEGLCGFTLRVEHEDGIVQVARPDRDSPLWRDVDAFGSGAVAKSFSSDRPLQGWTPEYESIPLPATFYCDDPNAEILATYEGNGRPAVASKESGGRRSYWIGAPEAPWQLWRNLCAEAGVHIYSETGDYPMANEKFVALYCITEGEKQITLPQTCRALDAQTDAEIAQNTKVIRFTAKAGETRSFTLNPIE